MMDRRALDVVRKKLVIAGDGECGKTSLLVALTKGVFPQTYVPTIVEVYVEETLVDNTLLELSLWDVPGQDDYCRLRSAVYPDAGVLLVCFSVDNPESAFNVTRQWIPEIIQHCSGRPEIILVGTKIDLRDDDDNDDDDDDDATSGCDYVSESRNIISTEEGLTMAERIGAFAYVECSAKTQEGVSDVFLLCMAAASRLPDSDINSILDDAEESLDNVGEERRNGQKRSSVKHLPLLNRLLSSPLP